MPEGRYVLDTDTLTALQHNHPGVVARVGSVLPAALFVAIVSVEEQVAGRLHALHGQLSNDRLVEAYQRLHQTVSFFAAVSILPYDQAAARRDEAFQRLYRRMGAKDRRIAAITWVNGCTLVTRNTLHFQPIAGLTLENWIDPPG
ncbi:MAG: type II toxin-antitoxin system VapC family toxin [Chloroflexota bacterium]